MLSASHARYRPNVFASEARARKLTTSSSTGTLLRSARQGIDTRITTWESVDQIVQFDTNGHATLIDPNSPQLVLIPIVEDPNGQTNWLNGSGWVRVVGFAWFIITPPPGYTNNGKTVTGVFVGLEDVATAGDTTGAYNPTTNTSYTIELTG